MDFWLSGGILCHMGLSLLSGAKGICSLLPIQLAILLNLPF